MYINREGLSPGRKRPGLKPSLLMRKTVTIHGPAASGWV